LDEKNQADLAKESINSFLHGKLDKGINIKKENLYVHSASLNRKEIIETLLSNIFLSFLNS